MCLVTAKPCLTAWILGKAWKEKELVLIPALTVEAIRRYLTHRIGPARGPLFLTRGSRGRNRDGRLETAAIGVGQLVKSTLAGTSPNDPVTMVTITVVLVAVALVSTLAPAWRAATLDPMVALRAE